MDAFKHAKDPIWQRAWKERIQPQLGNCAKLLLSVELVNHLAIYSKLSDWRLQPGSQGNFEQSQIQQICCV